MKFIAWLNLWLGLAMAMGYVFIFYHLSLGGFLVEKSIFAVIEFTVFVTVTVWFAWQIAYWIRRLK